MSASVRNILYQVVAGVIVLAVAWYLVGNTLDNLARQNIATGFGYLDLEAAFGISEHMIDYAPTDDYARALLVGILNTVKVAVIGILLATLLGLVVGIMRLSPNWLLARLAAVYIHAFRNVPVLLQLVFWAAFIRASFPSPREVGQEGAAIFLTNRGIYFPWPELGDAGAATLVGLAVGLLGWFFLRRWALARQMTTGRSFPHLWAGLGLALAFTVLGWLLGGAHLVLDMPALAGFNFRGGARMTPEFAAVLFGLTIYTSAFIAEVVRSGIQAVPRGQWEAAESLGLRRGQMMRLIILPQAMRVIVPPLTNQYLNLTKNSSLAVAVGYPDLVSISNTTMNQTGQAIEAISIFMAIYLALSILTSVFMNWFNARMALVER
ncbi:amino acid ABC transporter permease [Marinibaculum pumilum]|uniref:Amino acid ABC transporter permease n=1 Tax=Marinibaculum pumilum TaxID=1766165 RepID=A0ABV7KVU5_9PROT